MSGEDSADIDWNTDDELEILAGTVNSSQPTLTAMGNGEASSSAGVSHVNLIKHFVGMGFSEKLVAKAIEETGVGDTEAILNTILTFVSLEEYPEQPQQPSSMTSDPSSSDCNEMLFDELSDSDSWSENEDKPAIVSDEHKRLLMLENTGSLSEEEKKQLTLANMGFTVEEAAIAMRRCGSEEPISVLVDCIYAAQMVRESDFYMPEDDLKPKRILGIVASCRKRKHHETRKKKNDIVEDFIRLPKPMIGFGVPSIHPERTIFRTLPQVARGPPYFYYENVALAPKGVWEKISKCLLEIEPEFVDSKYFSATARKRGYVHNLPIENRFPLVPLPPMTIQQAFPLSRKWWPSWDTRDKLNCIQTAIGSAKLTERIRGWVESCEGEPPESVKRNVLEQCRKWNLVWVGRNKVAPLEPDEMEMLLGFPKNHTRGGGISRTDRYKSLGNSFQLCLFGVGCVCIVGISYIEVKVDTVAYHLSVLKEMYPNGINMLSLFSGIGGAEVALHRLGIKLKNVVSVEKSKVNRDIVRSWWEQTNQTGNLTDYDDVQQFDSPRIEQIMDNIGGFDLVVGGSPCNNLAGSNRVSRDGLEGKESSLFYDYFRILDIVREHSRYSQQI
ncbi:DNA (Cytosine-5)-methyltransferase DRM2 [Striga asiatica]|uniref:DNA (cytosine-5-)-methyltransferase n=1 Tax=Striga asiatica TaxID=4170 RepID=A0A5A7Q8T5_STRAF|nr:DNA (Cytosine-5)-methyltransferase DRM2 [Striga asiatica]